MEDIKMRLTEAIASRLSAAPDSRAKSELVEELADNLYQRYLELTASGTAEDEAYRLAMEDLGDVSELIDYLNSLSESQSENDAATDPLDALMQDVEEIAQNVFTRARDAVQEAKRRLKDEGFFNYRSPRGHVEVDIINGFDEDRPEHPYKKDVVYGVGYDKSKGGFYAQWGEWKGDRKPITVSGVNPVETDGLRGIDIENLSGDVTLSFDQPEDASISYSGNVSELELYRTEEGVLVIRQGRTASASSLLRRGLGSCDIELSLPYRNWDFLRIKSFHGDVELDGSCHIEDISVEAVNGDIEGNLSSCACLELKSASGDIEWNGCCAGRAFVESLSGDLNLSGSFNSLTASAMSGDIEVDGSVKAVKCSTMSGDIRLETESLPHTLTVASKSGDCHLRLPDAGHGSFTARLRTVSGDIDSRFPITRIDRGMLCTSGEGGPEYSISTVSGDIDLDVY